MLRTYIFKKVQFEIKNVLKMIRANLCLSAKSLYTSELCENIFILSLAI